MAEGHQRGDGGLEKRLVTRPLLAAGDSFGVFRFRRAVFGRGLLGLLRALPAVHRLLEHGAATGWRKRLLAHSGACPPFSDFAEIAADAVSVRAEDFCDFASRVAGDIEPLDLGQERVLLGGIVDGSYSCGGRFFAWQLIIHVFLSFSRVF
jgi:hypothetical protein